MIPQLIVFDNEAGRMPDRIARGRMVGARLDELREASRSDGERPWTVCAIQLQRAGGRLHADFVYEDAQQWRITPETRDGVAERARPG